MNPQIAQSLAFGGMFVVVPLVLRRNPRMAEVGLTTRDFGRNVLLGLWAFLLELPVTGAIAIVCALLLKNLPQPEHPASTSLMNSPDLLTVVATFFGGALVAPFWEETMFRGLLFPALRGVLRGPVPAALVSSFLFASIHPQGPVLWAALATVAPLLLPPRPEDRLARPLDHHAPRAQHDPARADAVDGPVGARGGWPLPNA